MRSTCWSWDPPLPPLWKGRVCVTRSDIPMALPSSRLMSSSGCLEPCHPLKYVSEQTGGQPTLGLRERAFSSMLYACGESRPKREAADTQLGWGAGGGFPSPAVTRLGSGGPAHTVPVLPLPRAARGTLGGLSNLPVPQMDHANVEIIITLRSWCGEGWPRTRTFRLSPKHGIEVSCSCSLLNAQTG